MTAAGNLDTDNAIVEEMSSALQSRMVHFEQISHTPSWLNWARTSGQIDTRITSYMNFMPGHLNNFNPNKQGPEKAYACERTWDFVHRYLKVLELDEEEALPCIAGCIGHGLAREFINYTKVFSELAQFDEILRSPTSAVVPSQPGAMSAQCGSLAQNASEDTMDKIVTYLDRFPKEFQVVCLTECGQRHPELESNKEILNWMMQNAKDLF